MTNTINRNRLAFGLWILLYMLSVYEISKTWRWASRNAFITKWGTEIAVFMVILAFLAYFTMLRNVGDMRRLVKEQNSLFAPIYFITTALLGFSLISFTVFVGLWTHTAGGDDVVLFFQFSFIGLIFLIDAIRTFSSHSIGKHLKNSFTTTNFITIPAVVYGYTYGGEFGGLVAIAFLFMGYIVFFPSLWILSLIFEPSSRKNPAKNEIHDPDPL